MFTACQHTVVALEYQVTFLVVGIVAAGAILLEDRSDVRVEVGRNRIFGKYRCGE